MCFTDLNIREACVDFCKQVSMSEQFHSNECCHACLHVTCKSYLFHDFLVDGGLNHSWATQIWNSSITFDWTLSRGHFFFLNGWRSVMKTYRSHFLHPLAPRPLIRDWWWIRSHSVTEGDCDKVDISLGTHTHTHLHTYPVHSPFPSPYLLFPPSANRVHTPGQWLTDIPPHHIFPSAQSHTRSFLHTHIVHVLCFVFVSSFDYLFVWE